MSPFHNVLLKFIAGTQSLIEKYPNGLFVNGSINGSHWLFSISGSFGVSSSSSNEVSKGPNLDFLLHCGLGA